eukprot:8461365-Pyramimonas_sp.AAC.1
MLMITASIHWNSLDWGFDQGASASSCWERRRESAWSVLLRYGHAAHSGAPAESTSSCAWPDSGSTPFRASSTAAS